MLLLFFLLLHCSAAAKTISRPHEGEGPTHIRVFMYLLDVDDVKTADQIFDANVYVELNWHDSRLAHKSAGRLPMNLNEIWHPNVQFINQQRLWSTIPDIVHVSPDGDVSYGIRVWGSFSQPLDLLQFPFDRQIFEIKLVESGYTIDEVILEPHPTLDSGIAQRLSLPDWDILSFNTEAVPFRVNAALDYASGFTFAFEARRHTGYFIAKVILPLVLIVAMSWVVFWIDPQHVDAQFTVAVTAMLTLIAYRFSVGTDLPHISYLTRIDYFILGSTILIFLSMIEVLLTSSLAAGNRLSTARKLDRWSRLLFPITFLMVSAEALYFRVLL